MNPAKTGASCALGAFVLWGILPVFWKALGFLTPPDIVAHRSLWSLVFLLPVLLLRRRLGPIYQNLRTPAGSSWSLLSGALLASNWLIYVWATLNGHIIESALGYYLTPFINMLVGVIFFGERHTRLQLTAIAIAAIGVGLQFPAIGHLPWIAILLATTFSLYAAVRKQAPLGSLTGLGAEALMIAPIALVWLLMPSPHHSPPSGFAPSQWLLIAATGLATTIPLLLFAQAARSIRLSTLGILQFIAPTLQFLIGWLMYDEPLGPLRILSFSLIWLAIALYAASALPGPRKNRPPA